MNITRNLKHHFTIVICNFLDVLTSVETNQTRIEHKDVEFGRVFDMKISTDVQG